MIETSLSSVHGACPHDCYDTCGLKLEVDLDAGRIIRIGPDSLQPLTRNFLCLKVNRYLERLYHPDRVLHPLKRVGKKGAGDFVRVSWDEALTEIAARLHDVRTRFGGEAILPYSFAGNMGILAGESLDARFFHAIGASRLDRTICTAASGAALDWVYGTRLGPDPEVIPQSRCIILWGTNPVATNVHEIPLLEEARAAGAQIWTIDPLATETARRYTPHLRPRPGTDLSLALGLGRELLQRGWVDRQSLQKDVRGLDAYEKAAEPWTLARTAAATGIPQLQIAALAEQLATARPLLFRTGYGVQRQHHAARTVWAISALSVLTGSFQDVGGGHLLTNSGAFVLNQEALSRPDLMERPTRRLNMVELGRLLTDMDEEPPVKALVVYNSNPAATAPDQAAVLRGLARPDLLVVVHEQMLTDTARYADYVLPAAMAMETLDLHTSYWHRYIQLARPATSPAGEAVSNPEFFRRLARAMGLTHPALYEDDEALIRTALDVHHPWMAGITWDTLATSPVAKVRLPAGARVFVDTAIPTDDGRFHLDPLPVRDVRDDQDETRYPLHFISPSVRESIKSSFANIKSLQARRPVPELLVARADLERFGIESGQWVRLYNQRGATRLLAVESEVPVPGTVVSYAVRWNEAAGGTNINQLTGGDLSDAGGGATFYSARVAIAALPANEDGPAEAGSEPRMTNTEVRPVGLLRDLGGASKKS